MAQLDGTALRLSERSVAPERPLEILLVEDSRFDAALVRALLTEVHGIAPIVRWVTRLMDAEEAMGNSPVDCVLLDLGLPDARGIEVVRGVVGSDSTIPIVVLTGVDDGETPLQALHAGAQDFLSKRELTPQLLWRTVRNAMERKAHELSLLELATHDRLTGLANRELFSIHLGQAVKRLAREADSLAVMFVDLDSFKWVNDSLGHAAGDQILRAFAERLCAALRPQDVAARLGGDEFMVLCEGIESEHVALALSERILNSLQTPFDSDGRTVWLRASVGVTLCSDSEAVPAELIRQSDEAMYRAKEAGKSQSQLYDEQLRRNAVDRLRVVDDLHRALATEEFRLYYQPIVDLDSGRAVGAEALVRRQLPDGRVALPGEFIALAEESGLILPLGDWILEDAACRSARWAVDAPSSTLATWSVSINAAAIQITDPDFCRRVRDIIERTGIHPGQVGVEVTETALMRNEASSLRTMRALKEMGLSLVMDDFGTGYSSLTYLQRYPFDVIKLDMSFIQMMGTDRHATAIVEGVIALGASLGLLVVGEGVETQAQADRLRDLGCPRAQGFHFATPTPPDLLDPATGLPRAVRHA